MRSFRGWSIKTWLVYLWILDIPWVFLLPDVRKNVVGTSQFGRFYISYVQYRAAISLKIRVTNYSKYTLGTYTIGAQSILQMFWNHFRHSLLTKCVDRAPSDENLHESSRQPLPRRPVDDLERAYLRRRPKSMCGVDPRRYTWIPEDEEHCRLVIMLSYYSIGKSGRYPN